MWFILLVGYIILTVALHSVSCYCISKGTAFSKFLIIGTAVGCVLLFNFYKLYGLNIHMVSAALVYAFVCELYIFMFSFVSSSISVSILLRLASSNSIVIDKLAEDYTGKTMVANRIKRLEDINLLSAHNNELHTTTKGKQLLSNFNTLQKFFRLT